MKKKMIMIITVLLPCIILSLTACSLSSGTPIDEHYTKISDAKLGEDAKIAQTFLQDKGYQVLAYSSGTSSTYQLTEEKLNDEEDLYENHKWALQGVRTESYIGKTVNNERFIVKNHPLDNWKSGDTVSKGMTYVDVMIVEGKAVGGISVPYTKEKMVGMPYSLEGKTLEEINKK